MRRLEDLQQQNILIKDFASAFEIVNKPFFAGEGSCGLYTAALVTNK